MPNWSRPCPIHADVAPNLDAGGATSFVFDRGEAFRLGYENPRIGRADFGQRVASRSDAHDIRQPFSPADCPAGPTKERALLWSTLPKRTKQQVMLINFLRTDHGIAFDKLFAMKEYPHDVLPLYSEGYSLARYLIEQGGREKFMEFVSDGMKSENWPATTKEIYGYASLQDLQDQWLDWVKQGSPTMPQRSVGGIAANSRSRSGEQPLYLVQSDDRESLAAGKPSVADRGMRNSTVPNQVIRVTKDGDRWQAAVTQRKARQGVSNTDRVVRTARW